MPKFEIEIGDNGELMGDAPAELSAIFKRTETAAHGAGFTKGTTEATEQAKARIEAAIVAERARLEALAPLQKEQFERESTENKTLKTQLLELSRAHSNSLKSQEERNAQALLERSERNKVLGERIIALTKESLRGYATRFGSRDESLSELEVILHSSIGYDDKTMTPYVKNGDGSKRTVQGKDMTVEAYVKEYLDTHTHHRKPTQAGGGGARGGATFGGSRGDATVSADAARDRINGGDRSGDAVNDLFEATRQRKTA